MMKRIITLFIALLPLWAWTAGAQDSGLKTVTGTVLDEDKMPLVGVSILVEGTRTGTSTDANGRYSIRVRGDQTLLFQYIGFVDLKEKVGRRSSIDVTMFEDLNELDQVVVIGYGAVRKTDLTGSATAVDMKNLKDSPITSVDHALQGRIAGADIMSTTGEPGATTSIRIRGTRSITATNEPLIVVDGVIDGINDLNDINSADIASITVLKDASSTAIYGARGANGVIVITTKTGSNKKGRPDITFRADGGISMLPRRIDIMNGTEFARFRNDLALYVSNDSYEKVTDQSPLSSFPYKDPDAVGKATDWIEEITRVAPYQNYGLSISGRTDAGQYYASLGYTDNEGIIRESGEDKYNMRLNIDRKLFDWLRVGIMMNYNRRKQRVNQATLTGTSWWSAAIFLSPMIKPDSDFNDLWYSGQKFNSPNVLIDHVEYDKEHLLMNDTAFLEIKPLKGLVFKSQFTYKTYQRHDYYYSPGYLPAKKVGEGGTAERYEYDNTTLSSENTLNYNTKFGDHSLDLLAGFTLSRTQSNSVDIKGVGYTLDQLKWNNMGAIPDKQNLTPSSSSTLRIIESFLGRANYNWKSRYYLTGTFRYDGASNFAAQRKWAFFPSAAFKWNIHNEPFMRGAKQVDELALRLSAGRAGNNGISPYQSLARINSNASAYLFNTMQMGSYVDRLGATDLTWEITDTYNAALDMSFFNKRLNMTAEAYYARTRDLLLNVQIADQTGFSSMLANVGRTRNKGVELSVESYNILKPKFSWTTSFTISHNSQLVEDIGTDDFVDAYAPDAASGYRMYGYVKGYPLNALWGFQDMGVWHNQEEIQRNRITHAYATKYESLGCSKYADINHDGVLDKDDLVYLGNADPVVYGGLQNTFNIHGFAVSLYFNYSLGGKIYHIAELYNGNGSQFTNQMRYMQNAWHATRNPDSNIPRAGSYDRLPSDRILYDASYIRFKSASVSYTFDLRKATRNTLRDLRLSVSGDNLYLWKYYAGFDPDVSTSSGGSVLRRVDNDAYPKARMVMFSLQLRY